MKISANELRIGMLIEHNGKLWTVTKLQHIKPGKGGAFMQTEMKDIKVGTKLNERFRSEASIEQVRLDEKECQLLYREGDTYTFMDTATYEQFQLDKATIGENANYLQDNMSVTITSYEGEIIGIVIPNTVIMEVIEADAVVKKQTATASYKPALLENGLRILVPPHIEAGMKIVVTHKMAHTSKELNKSDNLARRCKNRHRDTPINFNLSITPPKNTKKFQKLTFLQNFILHNVVVVMGYVL